MAPMGSIAPPGGWIYGIQLPVQTLTRRLADPWEDAATVDDLVTVAGRAEATGHSFVGVCDHVAIPDNDYAAHMTTTWYDHGGHLGLSGRSNHHRQPGRGGMGGGLPAPAPGPPSRSAPSTICREAEPSWEWEPVTCRAEFDALGVDFASRGRRLDEIIDVVRGAFGAGYVSHHGEFFSYDGMGVAPRPRRELPVWVGGMGRAAWRRCGRFGDGYIPMGNPKDQYAEIIGTIEQ